MDRKSRLVRFEKRLDANGNQLKWRSEERQKTFFKFDVEFSDGTVGVAQSTSTTPKWETGVVYTFTVSESDSGYPPMIKGMKKADSVIQGTSHYDKPEVQHNISVNSAIRLALLFIEKQMKINAGEKINVVFDIHIKYAEFFLQWIEAEEVFSSSRLLNRRSSLERSIESIGIDKEVTSKESVIQRAEEWFKIIMEHESDQPVSD